jgi:hypothetical protein
VKWPDGTPKSQNNAFDWQNTSGLSMASEQAAKDKANNTTKHIDKRRKAGDDVRAVRGMGAAHILRQQQVVAYSKAKVSTK